MSVPSASSTPGSGSLPVPSGELFPLAQIERPPAQMPQGVVAITLALSRSLQSHQLVQQHIQQGDLSVARTREINALTDQLARASIQTVEKISGNIQALIGSFLEETRSLRCEMAGLINERDLEARKWKKEVIEQALQMITLDSVVEQARAFLSLQTEQLQRFGDEVTVIMRSRLDAIKVLQLALESKREQDRHEIACAIEVAQQQMKEQAQQAAELKERCELEMEARRKMAEAEKEKREDDHKSQLARQTHEFSLRKAELQSERERLSVAAEEKAKERDHELLKLGRDQAHQRDMLRAECSHKESMANITRPSAPRKRGCTVM